MLMVKYIFLFFLCYLHVSPSLAAITIGTKNFNESYLLGEIMAQLLEVEGFEVERRFGLGGTLVCYEALLSGEIDIYVEYTGTLAQVILKHGNSTPEISDLNGILAAKGLRVLGSFGFNNTYAIAIKEALATKLKIDNISQLRGQPNLRMAFSLEFLNREDGWPGLMRKYNLSANPRGIEHGLAYQAIHEGKIDITDAYSTDGDLERYRLTVLSDDQGYFPQYLAVPFVRSGLPNLALKALSQLEGLIDDERMRALNSQTIIHGNTFSEVARTFLIEQGFAQSPSSINSMSSILDNTITHLKLTLIALVLGVLLGLPLGIIVFRSNMAARVMVYCAGLLQTIPSIALLALMIPLFGIGEVPAIIALFLYSILPILRNTITALVTIDPLLKRVAEAIGLTSAQQLRYVLLPMALPTILAGIKTAAIISIGTATLAAFIGAGGLGEPIVTGLALNDTDLILQGAIPAACLAICVELFFELLERLLVKPHMLQNEFPS